MIHTPAGAAGAWFIQTGSYSMLQLYQMLIMLSHSNTGILIISPALYDVL